MKKEYYCTNCGLLGHLFRNCQSPVMSYGIIAMRGRAEMYSAERFCSRRKSLVTGIERASDLQILLIQRRDSLSFIEFIRGKWRSDEKEYLGRLFKNMTHKEHSKIRSLTFENLWNSVWGDTANTHRTDYENSERKYNELGKEALLDMIDKNPTKWEEPEWGFPKGRRNRTERDIICAIREFNEETNLTQGDFKILTNIEPLVETFFGSNHIHYCHKYYLAICPYDLEVEYNTRNPHMAREIGAIGWFNLEDAVQKIRPDNVEKREILLKAGRIMRNFCPLV
jgi:8-oxo-dGTP pyrophosphatase MutT (NUDIX family)